MKLKSFLLLLLFTLFSAPLLAQSLAEIQNVKIDNLSDAQIEQFIKRAEA
jgi:hypothetical protein